jgi:DNA-binding transcriptional ArsR family regulator
MSVERALKAVAEPRRQAMLRLLRDEGGLTSTDLGKRLEITQQAASLHLKTLEEAGLVEAQREGVRMLYSVRTEGFAPVEAFLREFWGDHLTALKKEIEDDA